MLALWLSLGLKSDFNKRNCRNRSYDFVAVLTSDDPVDLLLL